jgi:hypothetical protein
MYSPSQIVGRDLNPAPIEYETLARRSLEEFKEGNNNNSIKLNSYFVYV